MSLQSVLIGIRVFCKTNFVGEGKELANSHRIAKFPQSSESALVPELLCGSSDPASCKVYRGDVF